MNGLDALYIALTMQMNGLDALYIALTMQSEMCARPLSLHQVP